MSKPFHCQKADVYLSMSLTGFVNHPGPSPFLMKAEQLDTIPSTEEGKPEPRVNALSASFRAVSSKLTEGHHPWRGLQCVTGPETPPLAPLTLCSQSLTLIFVQLLREPQ